MLQLKTRFMLTVALTALSSAPVFAEKGVAVTIENKTSSALRIEYWAGGLHSAPRFANVSANSSDRITGETDALSRWDIVGKVSINYGSEKPFCFAGRNPSIGYPLFAVSDDVKYQDGDDAKNAWKVCKDPNWLTGGDGGMKFSTDESASFSQSAASGSALRKDDSDNEKEFVLTINSIK